MLRRHNDTEEINNEIPSTSESSLIEIKIKRNALRNTLEELIVEYLKDLTTDHDEYLFEFKKRQKRSAHNEISISDENENSEMNEPPDVFDDSGGGKMERFEIGFRNITVSEISYDNTDHFTVENVIAKRSECTEQFRKISSLSQLDLDNVQQNKSDSEHNIRRVLNNR